MLIKAIETQSLKENFELGHLYEPVSSNFEKLKISTDVAIDQIWELIDYGIATQIFELKYDEVNGDIEMRNFIVSNPDGVFTLEDHFKKMMVKSASRIKRYVFDKKILTEEIWRTLLIKLTDPDLTKQTGDGDELERWIDLKKFIIPPSKQMISMAKEEIKEELDLDPKLIVLPKIGFFSLAESQSNQFLQIAYELLIAKIEPLLKSLDFSLKERLDEFYAAESANLTLSAEGYEISYIRKHLNIFQSIEELIFSNGFTLYFKVMDKLAKTAEKVLENEKKTELDKLINVHLKMLENTFDFDSRLLRLNMEKEDERIQVIIEQLKKYPNVLSAEWQDEEAKIMIFALKNVNSLKEINKIIYENHRFTTEYILYFKAIIEYNEPDIKAIFKDEEFVKLYGRNLQAVYFKYIPWFYKLFYFLGITPLVNIGYAKAKSIIAYSQMDRQFKHKKRRESFFKRKLREREERNEKERKFQNKRILLQAIDEALFAKKTLPTVEWILSQYPIFRRESLEKLISDFAFQIVPKGELTEHSILLYPNTVDHEAKIQKTRSLFGAWSRGEDVLPKEQLSRLSEIRSDF
ncbi:hypothetical protein LPTSP4_35200 [Leptospira ryugenii]|uniref:Uncharacterized protein n=1 Tax=Leptospira ryugenii TaxID=1917863 RepID=A0A2P2E540_9LEPT|nr:hypothetical protein [Leptospira ryugenii]GBF51982.1 hypothetical protein LPTSP4_35200 [Leptospira ryugenii]